MVSPSSFARSCYDLHGGCVVRTVPPGCVHATFYHVSNGIRQEMKTDGFHRLLALLLKRATEPPRSIRVWYHHTSPSSTLTKSRRGGESIREAHAHTKWIIPKSVRFESNQSLTAFTRLPYCHLIFIPNLLAICSVVSFVSRVFVLRDLFLHHRGDSSFVLI